MRSIPPLCLALLLGLVAMAGGAAAQGSPASPNNRQGTTMPNQNQADAVKVPPPTAATSAYRQAGTQWQRDIGIRYSGDADKDFAALLAAHDKGVAALARIQLQYGTDPEMRALAEAAVAASDKQAALLQAWLAKHK